MILKTFSGWGDGPKSEFNFFLTPEMLILEKFCNSLQEQLPGDPPLKRVVDLILICYLKTMPTPQIKV